MGRWLPEVANRRVFPSRRPYVPIRLERLFPDPLSRSSVATRPRRQASQMPAAITKVAKQSAKWSRCRWGEKPTRCCPKGTRAAPWGEGGGAVRLPDASVAPDHWSSQSPARNLQYRKSLWRVSASNPTAGRCRHFATPDRAALHQSIA